MDNRKPIPKSVLIFGATGRVGGSLAEYLSREAPSVKLRLATSRASQSEALRSRFPAAEVVVADYCYAPSLRPAVADMEGVFVITNSGTDERLPMTNLISVLKESRALLHVVRLLGLQPEASALRIPQALKEHGLGLPVQHPIVKRRFDESALPVTYLNVGATFMDNFAWKTEGLRRTATLIWPERMVPFVAARDVGEVTAKLLMSDNHRHIGQFHTMNNGNDFMRFSDVAKLMSDVWGRKIAYDGSRESFFSAYSALGAKRLQYLWEFFKYEADNEVVWALNDFAERMLGRKPLTLRQWLEQNQAAMLG